jgi:ABC-2 type transport system permease protein
VKGRARVAALLAKELIDLRGRPGLFFPALFTGAVATLLPLFVAVLVPAFTGEPLSDSADLEIALELYRQQPSARALEPEAAIQASLFQQFLALLVLSPVAASMSIAAFSVIGEKQARTLEPLLATPITTFELLLAKILGAFLPAVALSLACFAVYVGVAAVFAYPGVAASLLMPRPLAMVFLMGPMASLTALTLAVCVSSRVNDARSAQQLAVLVVLPITGLLIAQIAGGFVVTVPIILLITGVMAAVNVGLIRLGVSLFDRETILTRWK